MTDLRTTEKRPPTDPGVSEGRDGLLIYLVNPWKHVTQDGQYSPPTTDCLGMNYVASVLRTHGYSVSMTDAFVTRQKPAEIIAHARSLIASRPVFLGFSFMCPTQLELAEEIVTGLRAVGVDLIHVTAGGQFASTSHGTLLKEFPEIYDSVTHGEAEATIPELVSAVASGADWRGVAGVASLDAGEVRFARRVGLPDLETLPWPARDTLPEVVKRDGVVNLDTSRGCESSCIFCMSREILCTTATKDRWRSRAPEDVADEIAWIHRESGLRRFNFTDENTIGNRDHRDRMLAFADALEERELDIQFNAYIRAQDVDEALLRRLHEVGLASVFIGIESFWQPTLDLLNKRVKAEDNVAAIRAIRRVEGLRFYFGLMTFHPWVTLEEILFNLSKLRAEVLGISLTGPEILRRLLQVMLIYKGTPSYKLAMRDGMITEDARFDQGICGYELPEEPRKVLHFLKGALSRVMDPHFRAFQVASAPEHRADAELQARFRELNVGVDTMILDATEAFIGAVAEDADDERLGKLFHTARASAEEWAAVLDDAAANGPKSSGPVDQPLETFLREVERLGA